MSGDGERKSSRLRSVEIIEMVEMVDALQMFQGDGLDSV